jgi:hypothetical protein
MKFLALAALAGVATASPIEPRQVNRAHESSSKTRQKTNEYQFRAAAEMARTSQPYVIICSTNNMNKAHAYLC